MHPRRDGTSVMFLDEFSNLGFDNVVAAAPVWKDAQLVVQFLGSVHAHRDADVVLRQEVDDRGREQGRVGGETEVDRPGFLLGLFASILDYLLQQRVVHQSLTTEERDLQRVALGGLLQEEGDCGLRRLQIHELRLAFGRGNLVGSVLVAILTGQIALIGEVQHQGLKRKVWGRILHSILRTAVPRKDSAGGPQLFEDFASIGTTQPRGGQFRQQPVA